MNGFEQITTFVFDVDGVFTNGEVLVMENGDMLRTMSTRDGQAVRYAIEAGYRVAVITKGASDGVRKDLNTWASQTSTTNLKTKLLLMMIYWISTI